MKPMPKDLKINGAENETFVIPSGEYDENIVVRDSHNVKITTDGAVLLTCTERDKTHNVRNSTDIRVAFSLPGLRYSVTSYHGFHVYDKLNEESGNVTISGIRFERKTSFPCIKVTPDKESVGWIDGVSILLNMVVGNPDFVNAAFYLGVPLDRNDVYQGFVSNLLVSQNLLYGPIGDGIQAKGVRAPIAGNGLGCKIERNLITDTLLPFTSSQSAIGIMAGPGGLAVVQDNLIYYSHGSGVHVTGLFGGVAEIKRNLVYDSGKGTHANFCHGIHTRNKTSIIEQNGILKARGHGINISNRSTGSSAFDNTVLECGLDPIKEGGSPPENFARNYTGMPTDLIMPVCEQLPPPPPPQPEPRFWNVSFDLEDDGETLTASPVEIEETERTNERTP